MTHPADGRAPIERPGFSYLPQFIDKAESDALIDYFAALRPLWEQRHRDGTRERNAGHSGRLTRPVYWLGAWQFACLGYYSEPDHREHRCMRAEPIPQVMRDILLRLQPVLASAHAGSTLPETCLINYYGREIGEGPPVDYARLRMHRDHEPGPVIMFSIGQPGLLEFLDPERSQEAELALWMRHRSVCILSGADYKDRLYHRITRVRTGTLPAMESALPNFQLRRVSVSFRHVPAELIEDFAELPPDARARVRDYVETLAESSEHFQRQLRGT